MPLPRSPFCQPTNLDAAWVTLLELEAGGTLKPEDTALVTYVMTCAAAVDAAPTRAVLRKEYREALSELRRLHASDGGALADLVASLRAESRDPAAGSGQPGVRGGGDRPGPGDAADAVAANGGRRRARDPS